MDLCFYTITKIRGSKRCYQGSWLLDKKLCEQVVLLWKNFLFKNHLANPAINPKATVK